MKIDTSRLPLIQPERNQQSPVIKQHQLHEDVFQRTLEKESNKNQPAQAKQDNPVISRSEQKVFEDLFPQSASQVRAYQSPAYQPKSQTIMLGRIIDRRG